MIIKSHNGIVLHVIEAQYVDDWSTIRRDFDIMLHLELPNISVLRVYDFQGVLSHFRN